MCKQIRRRHDQRDATAERFQKLSTVEVEVIKWTSEELVTLLLKLKIRLVHSATSFAVPLAISIALTMRGYVPQRQTFASMCLTFSARLGFAFLFRSAAAAMIIPDVQ